MNAAAAVGRGLHELTARSLRSLVGHDALLGSPSAFAKAPADFAAALAERGYFGRFSATSDVFPPAPVANTMYCCPLCMKVIGTALVRDGIATAPTCLPVALSTA